MAKSDAPEKPKAKAKTAKPSKAAVTTPAPVGEESATKSTAKLAILVYTISVLFHAGILLVASFFYLPEDIQKDLLSLVSEQPEEDPMEEEEAELDPIEDPAEIVDLEATDSEMDNVNSEVVEDIPNPLELDINDLEPSMTEMEIPTPNAAPVRMSNEMGGRSSAARSEMVAKGGGSAASEKAVSSGLRWLKSVQHDDGGWAFDDLKGAKGAGEANSRTGATGMALLCYLGAGHTHVKGSYKDTVEKGIMFMLNRMKVTAEGGDLRGASPGNEGMYVQGICTTAVCEIYAMTPRSGKYRRQLKQAAELAVAFIINAQDPEGGGWRYRPRQPGDTSAVGWQVMALVSARNADIRIPKRVFDGASYFLDSVTADGSTYGYTSPQDKPSTTAVGLLCRMYMGWGAKHEGLQKGIAFLAKRGPSATEANGRYQTDMYYNYYATQVMHHWGGGVWDKWNLKMRDHLIKSQDQKGKEEGSWAPAGGHAGAKGGRLFQTALSVMTLEVYYRHLPIYKRKNVIATEDQLK